MVGERNGYGAHKPRGYGASPPHDGRPTGSTEPIFVAEYFLNPNGQGVGTIHGTIYCE